MPDLINREKHERRILRLLGAASETTLADVLLLLGDPPDINKLTLEVWAEIEKRFRGVLLPELETLYLESATALMDVIGVGVNFDLINTRAADWAQRYTYDLVRGINSNSQTQLQKYISDFFRSGVDKASLEAQIARLYGPVRAEMIAVTEVTRASVEGERALADEVGKVGLKLVPIHQSSNDDKVCPICAPRNGLPITDERYPPLHVKCRCFVTYEVLLEGKSYGLITLEAKSAFAEIARRLAA